MTDFAGVAVVALAAYAFGYTICKCGGFINFIKYELSDDEPVKAKKTEIKPAKHVYDWNKDEGFKDSFHNRRGAA
ncbi:hypothetical protein [Nicoliella lavandulae]|uniref:Uncharacterized protein n=1 Tax=Nicoliella lavandulae TaxID=3082954 RepID=A0ABU8SN69_9LACO